MLALKIIGITLGSIVGIILLYAFFLWFISLFVKKGKIYDTFSPFYYAMLQSVTFVIRFVARIKIKQVGFEKIPKDGKFLLVCNHTSDFDSILGWSMFRKKRLIFVSKQENFSWPIFGRYLSKCTFLGIDRSDPKQSTKVLHRVQEMLEKDLNSVAIYPEGTRNRELEKGLLPFHDGIFRPAMKAKRPIVVMTVHDANKVKDNFPKKASVVEFHIVDVIMPEEMEGESTHTISARARSRMEEDLY